MFQKNPDPMRMEETPERVLSACRLLARGSMSREALRAAMTLEKNGERELAEANRVIAVVQEELGLVRRKNDCLEFVGPAEVLASPAAFRRYVSAQVFPQEDTTFVKFSRWVIAKNEELFRLGRWQVMAETCKAELPEMSGMDENAALGWRFWAAFLGLGYLSGSMFLPNMKLRLQDIFAVDYPWPYGQAVRAEELIPWLDGRLPEADLSGRLPLAVSAGLRTLHELGLIRLETWRDSRPVQLYFVDGEQIGAFSHITVNREVKA